MKNFTYKKKVYVNEIAAADLSKIYFLKNAKKTCKPNNRDLNHDWIKQKMLHILTIAVWKIIHVCIRNLK